MSYSIRDIAAARRHIRNFSRELAGRCGKSPEFLEKDIIKTKKLNHISLGEYEWTGCYDMDARRKEALSTLWTRAQFRKTFTDRRYIAILMNKYIFSKVFSDFYGRTCLQCRDVDMEGLRRLAGETGKVVIKPNCKGQGKGVKVLPAGDQEELRAALEAIRALDGGIVEEFICQHPSIARLNPGAVSIIRFYSLSSPAGSYIFAPVLTVATEKDISNGCQDALTAMIDIRDGRVISQAVDQNQIVDYERHPVTGQPFRGLQIPFWQESLELMKRALPLAEKISNIGWDLAVTEEGPLIVEANTIPGFNTAQYRGFGWITEGYGYQPLFDEGMKSRPFTDMDRYERVLLKVR